ncbi:diguanylate cyclase [Azoarcus sp. L1K30]|uniref:GGDEF domain-containing protein n=1 Tax=Azoarcus sp. L1K30 TaxID=2820277 RepID=UPI001B831F1A|nr:GGDEF domain-containing protein [Azoarcus sp. L1K30]MBR0567194.1 diguanylate cyclase [Azoarcus sp. L1K30]
MNLKPRFLILTAALILLASTATWFAFQRITEGIVEQWGVRLAEAQVRYDSSRLMQPLIREIALSRQMAHSQLIVRWARQPDNPELTREAIAEMESFRRNFQDGSFFVALAGSGAYYHNNSQNEFAGRQLRYNLQPDRPADSWFYQIMNQGREFHLNVNPDHALGVTKLWIDVLIRDDDRILGVVGTGLDLDRFIRNIVQQAQPGVSTLFVDHNAAIQLYRDPKLIDFASIVKPEGEKKTIDQLLDHAEDRAFMRAAMQQLTDAGPERETDARVISRFVTVDGERHLAGVAYLPEIDWYEVTLLDLDVLMPLQRFSSVLLIFAATLLAALVLFNYVLNRLVLNPVAALEDAMLRVRDGDLNPVPLPPAKGEIGRLAGHFEAMSASVREHTHELESRVAARTEELRHLASVDPLTGLLNRRGLSERLNEEISRAEREGSHFGLLWVDIDQFKEINDFFGHSVGDDALKKVGEQISAGVRPYDCAARWGGDEFLILLAPCDLDTLAVLGERIRSSIESRLELPQDTGVTVSVGGCLAGPGDPLERILQRADQALYAAKEEGRNRVRIAGQETEAA